MDNLQQVEQEKNVLRWGGLAGLLGGILFMWQATRGILDAMLYVGFFVVPLGSILLSVGMLKTPAFGKGFGGVGLMLGVVGFVTAVLQIIDPASMIGAVSYFTIILFCFILGWKVFSLSKTLAGTTLN